MTITSVLFTSIWNLASHITTMTVHFNSVDIIVQITKSRIVQLLIDHNFLIYLLDLFFSDLLYNLVQILLFTFQQTHKTSEIKTIIKSDQNCTHQLVNIFLFVVYLGFTYIDISFEVKFLLSTWTHGSTV